MDKDEALSFMSLCPPLARVPQREHSLGRLPSERVCQAPLPDSLLAHINFQVACAYR